MIFGKKKKAKPEPSPEPGTCAWYLAESDRLALEYLEDQEKHPEKYQRRETTREETQREVDAILQKDSSKDEKIQELTQIIFNLTDEKDRLKRKLSAAESDAYYARSDAERAVRNMQSDLDHEEFRRQEAELRAQRAERDSW